VVVASWAIARSNPEIHADARSLVITTPIGRSRGGSHAAVGVLEDVGQIAKQAATRGPAAAGRQQLLERRATDHLEREPGRPIAHRPDS